MNSDPVMMFAAQVGPSIDAEQLASSPRLQMVGLFYLLLIMAGLAENIRLLVKAAGKRSVGGWGKGWDSLLSRSWPWLDSVRLLVLLLATYFSVLFMTHGLLLLSGRSHMQPVWALVIQSIAFHWAGLFLVGWTLVRRRQSVGRAFNWRALSWPRAFFTGLRYYLAALPLLWLLMIISQVVMRWLGLDPTVQEVALTITARAPWWLRIYMLFLAVVLAPLAEEFVFRGVLLPLLGRRLGPSLAVAAVSLVFALLHFHAASFLPLFAIGVAFSLAYIVSGSLAVPVVMHMLFNLVNLAMLFFLRSG